MTSPAPTVCPDTWERCYADSWRGIITPESFAHPAKMARGLALRIFAHAIAEGWIKPGEIVVDPFGGIGSTGIVGAEAGLQVVMCELEPRFVALNQANIERHRWRWAQFGKPIPRVVQGDSRRLVSVLCEVLAAADLVVSSPPYAETDIASKVTGTSYGVDFARTGKSPRALGEMNAERYGHAVGQLSALPSGDVGKVLAAADLVVSSPPYSETALAGGPTRDGQGYTQGARCLDDYGTTPGQLGALPAGDVDAVVGSPPFEGSLNDRASAGILAGSGARMGDSCKGDTGYGTFPGQLGALPAGDVGKALAAADCVVSSPPYEGSLRANHCDGIDWAKANKTHWQDNEFSYGISAGQVGTFTGETFWSAAREILQQCHQILRPGGVAIWVTKNFVRKGAVVPFSDDWLRLCESVGFQLVCRHRAMLVAETVEDGLFGTVTKTRERKSFFRRLAEKKGSPRIDWEDVLCLVKPSPPPSVPTATASPAPATPAPPSASLASPSPPSASSSSEPASSSPGSPRSPGGANAHPQ